MARSPVKKKKKRAAKSKAKPAKKRNYAAEYRRRIQRARALGYSRSVARGHPRKGKGEVGRQEIGQMRRAARVPTPGQQKQVGIRRPVSSHLRIVTRQRVAEIAGVKLPSSHREATRRTSDVQRFADAFLRLGLGTRSQAFSLWFSP